jgi:Glu-tRNA(Gln) amidotransferase subunit E-like FAD-binding protein
MYPDTDSEPVKITPERVEGIRKGLALRPWEKEERCRSYGVPDRLARQLADDDGYPQFERLAGRNRKLAPVLANLVCSHFPRLQRLGQDPARLTDSTVLALAHALHQKEIGQENLPALLLDLSASTPEAQEKQVDSLSRTGSLEPAEMASRVRRVVSETAAAYRGEPAKLFDAAMGRLLRKNRDLPVSEGLLKIVREEVDSAVLDRSA